MKCTGLIGFFGLIVVIITTTTTTTTATAAAATYDDYLNLPIYFPSGDDADELVRYIRAAGPRRHQQQQLQQLQQQQQQQQQQLQLQQFYPGNQNAFTPKTQLYNAANTNAQTILPSGGGYGQPNYGGYVAQHHPVAYDQNVGFGKPHHQHHHSGFNNPGYRPQIYGQGNFGQIGGFGGVKGFGNNGNNFGANKNNAQGSASGSGTLSESSANANTQSFNNGGLTGSSSSASAHSISQSGSFNGHYPQFGVGGALATSNANAVAKS